MPWQLLPYKTIKLRLSHRFLFVFVAATTQALQSMSWLPPGVRQAYSLIPNVAWEHLWIY